MCLPVHENRRLGFRALVALLAGLILSFSASAQTPPPPLFFVHGGNPGNATGFFAGDDDRPGIQAAIDAAMMWLEDSANVGAGPASVVFEPGGTYHLDSVKPNDTSFALIVRQLDRNSDWLHFVGNGATIVHRQLLRQTLGIHASQNVLVEGLDFDRDPLPYMDGFVEAVNGSVVTVQLVRGLSPLLFPPENPSPGSIRHWGWLLDPQIPGRPKEGSASFYEASAVSLTGSDPDVYDFVITAAGSTIAADFAVGDRFTYHYREGGNSLHIRNSLNIEIRDVTAYAASAMFVNSSTTTGLSVIDSRVAIRPGHWRSTNGDGLHIKRSTDLWVEGCSFQGVSDDGINVTEVDTFVLQNNVFANKRRHAILLDADDQGGNPPNSSNGQIFGNYAAFNGGSFISHAGGEYGISIHSNNVSSNNVTRTFGENRLVRLGTRLGGFAAAGVDGLDGAWSEGDAVQVVANLSMTDTAWHLQEVSGGRVIIINRAARDDGLWLYLVPAQASPAQGDPAVLRTGQGPNNPAAAEWVVEEVEGSEFARIRHADSGFYLALQPSAGGPAAGDPIGVEASSSSDVNQVWRIDRLEDGDQGVPIPLLGGLGRLLLMAILVAGAALPSRGSPRDLT
ncbi:MAG: right-handed parallel beta-helix repeat-containing protein [Myxococcota bacterium]|nr:right-handed parallel beta-helix repeat-containing protein [Myxococcota bacterium]